SIRLIVTQRSLVSGRHTINAPFAPGLRHWIPLLVSRRNGSHRDGGGRRATPARKPTAGQRFGEPDRAKVSDWRLVPDSAIHHFRVGVRWLWRGLGLPGIPGPRLGVNLGEVLVHSQLHVDRDEAARRMLQRFPQRSPEETAGMGPLSPVVAGQFE